jgi:hypothetical protein
VELCVLNGDPLKAEASKLMGLHDRACSMMELRGFEILVKPRHFLHHSNLEFLEIQLTSIESHTRLGKPSMAAEASHRLSNPHDFTSWLLASEHTQPQTTFSFLTPCCFN